MYINIKYAGIQNFYGNISNYSFYKLMIYYDPLNFYQLMYRNVFFLLYFIDV